MTGTTREPFARRDDGAGAAGARPPPVPFRTEGAASMTDAFPQQTPSLAESTKNALVDLVVRGMHRGPVSPAQDELVAAGYALAKGPILMPSPTGTSLA